MYVHKPKDTDKHEHFIKHLVYILTVTFAHPRGIRPYGVSHKSMIKSYRELHFGEQHDNKKGYGFKERMPCAVKVGSIDRGKRDVDMRQQIGVPWARQPYGIAEFDANEKVNCNRLREPDKSEDKVEQANVATMEAKENIIGVCPLTRWRRSCMRVVVCLSIDQGELLCEHKGIEAGGRKGEEATTSLYGLNYPKAKRRSKWRWTRSATVSQRRIY
ncbi:hypothetical protein BHE74_00015305 [Ensete ventricosum]|nr:hypothetical protein BHE74_00015305 [Ensete ventricosum]RZR93215.1 hypothetical protein BHM03_00021657 [Ensete ventricosum]